LQKYRDGANRHRSFFPSVLERYAALPESSFPVGGKLKLVDDVTPYSTYQLNSSKDGFFAFNWALIRATPPFYLSEKLP
jgi:hypothetical protein